MSTLALIENKDVPTVASSDEQPVVIGYLPDTPPTYEQWQERFQADLIAVHMAKEYLPWFLGDEYLYGERHFPTQFSQALPGATEGVKDNEEINESTVRGYAWVCDAFPMSGECIRRPTEAKQSVHAALAAVPDSATRAKLLDQAIREKWTVKKADAAKKECLPSDPKESRENVPMVAFPTEETTPFFQALDRQKKYLKQGLDREIIDGFLTRHWPAVVKK